MRKKGHFCTACNKTYDEPQPESMCPTCPNEALLDLSVSEQRRMAKEMEWDELDRSIWAYRISLGSVCGIIMGGLAWYFFWPLAPENPSYSRGYIDLFITLVVLGFFIGVGVGFGIASLVRRWVNRNTIKTVRYRD